MAVSENGCPTVYSATRRPTGHWGSVQAATYRESYTSRIAAIYHNNQTIFGAHRFSFIPKNGYQQSFQAAVFNQIYMSFIEHAGLSR